MFARALLSIGMLAALASGARADPLANAEAAVRAVLSDPGSARFEEVRARPGAVCGFVSARNGHGGYGAPVLFVYAAAERRAYVLDPSSTAGPAWAAAASGAYRRLCQP